MKMRSGLLSLAVAGLMEAQTFELASVKEITDPLALREIKAGVIRYTPHGNLYMNGVTLSLAIEWAFNVQRLAIEGPEWIYWRPANDQPRFQIAAQAAPGTSIPEARKMAQHLLEERFRLSVRYEDRRRSAYVLSEGPGGLKIEKTADTGEPPAITYAAGVLTFKGITMKDICDDLSLSLTEPVVEETALKGQAFNAKVNVTYEKGELVARLVAALQKDLGLKITQEKVLVRVLVITHVERHPAEN